MRVARQYRTTSKDNYNRFLREHPSIKITYKKYCEVISVCNRMFITKAIETGDPIKLPFGFGKVVVTKYRRKAYKLSKDGNKYVNMPVDWVKTRQEGYKVYNMNYHSDGYAFKWKWFYATSKLSIYDIWVMRPTRWASRTLAKYILSDKQYSEMYKSY